MCDSLVRQLQIQQPDFHAMWFGLLERKKGNSFEVTYIEIEKVFHEWETGAVEWLILQPGFHVTRIKNSSVKNTIKRVGIHVKWDIHPAC
jgi:hypothetical protein